MENVLVISIPYYIKNPARYFRSAIRRFKVNRKRLPVAIYMPSKDVRRNQDLLCPKTIRLSPGDQIDGGIYYRWIRVLIPIRVIEGIFDE